MSVGKGGKAQVTRERILGRCATEPPPFALFTRTRFGERTGCPLKCRATSQESPMIPSATHRPLVLAAVMAANFMVAIEATIVSTAMPQIVGKLADLAGRKRVMFIGIAAFLVGSILCGFAWSMPSLIVFRLIQGIGAGAVQPTAMTIVGNLCSPNERGKSPGWV